MDSEKKRALLNALLAREGLDHSSRIPRRPRGTAPLSYAQERLWYLSRLMPESPAYNIPLAYRLRGHLDPAAMETALNVVVQHHEVLRSCFPESDNPLLTFHENPHIKLEVQEVAKDAWEALIKEEAHKPFRLSEDLLLRARLLRLAPEDHILLLTIHHIVTDGWSLALLLREISEGYNRVLSGEEILSSSDTLDYTDYAHWQRERSSSEEVARQVDYWRAQLHPAPNPVELPNDHPRPARQSLQGRWITHTLPASLGKDLKAFARREGVTPLNVLLAAFKSLLVRYSGQTDILIGTPITQRTRAEFESMLGHFVNTLALRTDLSGQPTFRQVVQRLRETLVGAFANQEVAFEQLLDLLDTRRDPSRNPLFQIVFTMQDTPAHGSWRNALQLQGVHLEPVFTHSDTAKFDLTVEVEDLPQGLTLSFEYTTDLFEETTIRRMAGHFETLLSSALHRPEARISDLQMLTNTEIAQLAAWNNTGTDYPRESSIVALFEQQAAEHPEATALTFRQEHISYADLNQRANRVAAELIRQGVQPDDRVCIAAERGPGLIIGILGILKAGGGYTPLDPAYPEERLAYMLEDSGSQFVLVEEDGNGLHAAIARSGATRITLDPLVQANAGAPIPNPPLRSCAHNLAYTMYTSGSTGQPKGTAVTHRSVVRLVRQTNFAHFGPDQSHLLFSPIAFDASTLEIWGALLNGGRLVIAPPGPLSYNDLGDLISRENVSLLWLTSGLFHEMVERYPEGLAGVSQLFTGGDVVSPDHVRAMLPHLRDGKIINGYGPTENTTFTCTYPMASEAEITAPLPIGRPIANTTVYILDPDLNPVPVGVTGELYTGGDGLARGYLNQPGLTAEKFLPDPFAGQGARMYRTGDLARWRPDGTIDFLGRRDFQIKLRGFRIELGEIEAALKQTEGVKDGVVIAREGSTPGSKQLVAYVIPQHTELSPGDLRHHLSKHLPDYMVPGAFVFLDAFPLTDNGKLDRRALPEPAGDRPDLETAFAAPQSATEQTIAAIWQDVLEVDRVGLDDNFFDLGGHSILMLQVHSRLKATFDLELPIIEMFSHPTVRSMAKHILSREAEKPSLDDVRARGRARRRRVKK